MEWSDEALVLSVRSHGEAGAIVEVLTRGHGRYLGFVHGGRSRRLRPVLQTGNHVDVSWRARLAEQLGHFSVELRRGYAAETLADRMALSGLSAMATMATLLPEREPQPNLFEVSLFVMGFLDDLTVWPALYVRWELALLEAMGYGLELDTCAATGTTGDLVYVSPKSGRAVSAGAGAPYADRLLRLPQFLRAGRRGQVSGTDVTDGLRLTGHFLLQRVLQPQDGSLPEPRQRLVQLLEREA